MSTTRRRTPGPNRWRWIATALVLIAVQALVAIAVKAGDDTSDRTNNGRSIAPRP